MIGRSPIGANLYQVADIATHWIFHFDYRYGAGYPYFLLM